MIKYSIVLVCLINITILQGQKIGIGGGISLPTYWGDLNSNRLVPDLVNNTNLGVHLKAEAELFSFLSIGAGVNFGKLQGNDAKSHLDYQRDRNLNFYSQIFEVNGALQVHPFALRMNNSILIPFIQFNLSTFHFNPKTAFNDEVVDLQPLGTEGQGMEGFAPKYNLWAAGTGAGGGLKFEINENWKIILDSRLMLSNTDYLDDVSRFYVNFYELRAGNGILAAQLSDRTPEFRNLDEPLNRDTGAQRGGAAQDIYFMTNISFVYSLSGYSNQRRGFKKSSKIYCPEFK